MFYEVRTVYILMAATPTVFCVCSAGSDDFETAFGGATSLSPMDILKMDHQMLEEAEKRSAQAIKSGMW